MTTRHPRTVVSRGFTLIEVMISVAILSILASVAIPNFQYLQLRSRGAERAEIMTAIAHTVGDVLLHHQRLPASGDWNPAGIPGTTKRSIDWSAAGWKELPMFVEGKVYYSYKFSVMDGSVLAAEEHLSPAPTAALYVYAEGDLDGDLATSTRLMKYALYGEDGFRLVADKIIESPDNL